MVVSLVQWLIIVVRASKFYEIAMKVCEHFINAWKNSSLIEFFYKVATLTWIENSAIFKFLDGVFKFSRTIKFSGDSIIIKSTRTMLDNFLALSTHFLGLLTIGATLSYYLVRITLTSNPPTLWVFLPLILIAVLMFNNVSITGLVQNSRIVRFLMDIFKIDVDFRILSSKMTEKIGLAHLIFLIFLGFLIGIIINFVSIIWVMAGVVALIGALAVIFYAEAGLFALCVLAPFAPTMALVGVSLLSFFSLLLNKRKTLKLTVPSFLVLMLIVVFGLTSATSFAVVKSVQVWLVYCAFMLTFVTTIQLITTREMLNNLIKSFVISSLFVALYGIAQGTFGWTTSNAWIDESMFSGNTLRVYSTFENPNVLGEYFLLAIPLCVYLVFSLKEKLPKFAYSCVLLSLIYCLLLTQSRGCYLGFAVFASLFVTFEIGKLWGTLLFVVPFIPFLLPESVIQRITSIGDVQDSSTSYRLFIWLGTLQLLRDFWLVGIGMGEGAFDKVYPFYSFSTVTAPHSHNLFLQILTESGIVGFVFFISLMFVFLCDMFSVSHKTKRLTEKHLLAIGCGAGLCGFLLQSMFDYTFYNYRLTLLFWIFLAIGFMNKKLDSAG